MHYNVSEISSFLQFFSSSDTEIFTFAFLDKESKGPFGNGLSTWFGSCHEVCEFLSSINSTEWTLHVCLNATNDKGRKSADILYPRVFCVDLDRQISLSELAEIRTKYAPQLICESSEGRYHLYWKCGDINLGEWSDVQLALAYGLDGDRNLNSVSKTIRVPGVERLCKAGHEYIPRIVYLEENPREILVQDVFEEFDQWLQKGLAEKRLIKKEKRLAIPHILNGHLEEVKQLAANRGRNETLFGVCIQYIEEKGGELEDILEFGKAVNSEFTPPLEYSEMEKTVRSAFKRAERGELPEEESFQYDFSGDLKHSPYSDLGIILRISQKFGHRIVRTENNMYAFNDLSGLWEVQDVKKNNLLREFYESCVKDILREQPFLNKCKNTKGEFTQAKLEVLKERYFSNKTYQAIVSLFTRSTDSNFTFKPIKEFDNNSEIYFCQNGVLNLRSGELRESEPNDYLFIQGGLTWIKDSECTEWLTFMGEVFGKDQEMISFMQELFGYSLCGLIDEQKIFLHYGNGANGKSKVLTALRKLGGNLCAITDPDDFGRMKGGFTRAFERFGAKAEGKRIIIIDDLETASVWNEGLIKAITAPIYRARGEWETSREVINRGKFHLGLNVAPSPESETYGLIRRLCLIPYTEMFTPSTQTSMRIDTMIDRCLSGIGRWAQEGYVRYIERGCLPEPEALKLAIDSYKEDNFVLENVIRELFEVDFNSFISTGELHSQVLQKLQSDGINKKIVQQDTGNAIKNIFKLIGKRDYCHIRKNTYPGYTLKLKEEVKSPLETIMSH